MSNAEHAVLSKMGAGMRLFVRRTKPYDAKLLNPYMLEEIPVPNETAKVLILSGLISELFEFRTNNKIGWSEACLDGQTYHIYACTQ